MKDFMKYTLDIQLFGEGDPTPPGASDPTPPANPIVGSNVEVDYEKLANIVNTKSSTTEDKVLQGYFKSQGLSPEEVTQAIQQFKTTREANQQAEQQKYQTALQENAQLKAKIFNASVDSKVNELASGMGVASEKLPFLQKMVDRTKVAKEDGSLNDDAIKNAIEEVLKAFPDFKGNTDTQQQGGFQQIGSAGGLAGSTAVDAALDAVFGIKK